jgi:hypothetical protein
MTDLLEKLNEQKKSIKIDNNQLIEKLYSNKINFYLWGQAGTGKTEKILKLAEKHNDIVKTMSVTPLSTKGEFYGFISVDGSRYISTPFREAYENGYVFLLDEMDNISQNLAVSLNQSLSQSVLTFPDKTVKKHENFRFLGTGNTNGMGSNSAFSGRQKLDYSFKDRFVSIEWEFDENLELSLASNKDFTKLIQAIRKSTIEMNIPIQVTMRSSIVGSKLLENNDISLLDVLEYSVFKYAVSEETKHKIFNTAIVSTAIEKLLNINTEEEKEEEEESFSSEKETTKKIEMEIKEISKFNFTISNPDNIEKYKNLGFIVCTLDNSAVCKKNSLTHFNNEITIEKLQSLQNENICFVSHTQEKKNIIKNQLKGLGLI